MHKKRAARGKSADGGWVETFRIDDAQIYLVGDVALDCERERRMACTPPEPSEHNTPLPLSGSVYLADSEASFCPSYETVVISAAHRQRRLHK